MGHLPASPVSFVNSYPLRVYSYSSDERRVQARGIILMIPRILALDAARTAQIFLRLLRNSNFSANGQTDFVIFRMFACPLLFPRAL